MIFKYLITLLVVITTITTKAQIIENFNPSSSWLFTNGAGIQNYGGPENYATFNLGSSPYINSSEIIIESPTFQLDSCPYLILSFSLNGYIERFDTLLLQYYSNYEWITITRFTGYYDNPMAVYNAPSSATKFRFNLKTDGPKIKFYPLSLNSDSAVLVQDSQHPIMIDESTTYVAGRPLTEQVYYYDIASFKIECGISLPVGLLSLNAEADDKVNIIQWITGSENNNHYFLIEKSKDTKDWNELKKVNGFGYSSTDIPYYITDSSPYPLTYYRLTQFDYDGYSKVYPIISCYNPNSEVKLIKITNVYGQVVDETYKGLLIYWYADGSIIKRVIIK
jgi:hypothetical protein